MAASGLVHEDPDHIFVMMEFLFDIKKVGLHSTQRSFLSDFHKHSFLTLSWLNVSFDRI